MSAAAIVHPQLALASFTVAIRPLLTEPEKYEKLGMKLLGFSFPYLDVQLDWRNKGAKIKLRVDGRDFPYRPVGGWWIDDSGLVLLPGAQKVPNGSGFHTTHLNSQPGCWFCFKGWREYHDHSSHQDLSWASIRNDSRYSVLQLILQLQRDLNQTNVGVV